MRASIKFAILTLAILTCFVMAAFAQGGNRQRNYDPNSETTVKGTVEKVVETSGQRGWPGMHLTLRSSDQTYEVHVGPANYVSKNGFAFASRDQIEVTGSKLNQGNMIIAREIAKNGNVLTLRDSQGIPKWSRGQRWQ